MKSISKIFIQGLFAILPVVLTIAFIIWLVSTLETYLKQVILLVISEQSYWPGLGLLVGIVLIFALGLLIKAYLGQVIVNALNRLMERIPLVGAIYNAFNDMVKFLSPSGEKDLKQAVLLELQPGVEVIGFITSNDEAIGDRQGLVAVYVPLSYQIGGLTIFMPKDKCKELDMPASEAMKKVLTASMTQEKKN
ncbi:MAG: DUF502 domain-containing protein [Kangiellaceae bacterium]|nr:DUF502 domain-containing protein [Kangiellaceae bacterium]